MKLGSSNPHFVLPLLILAVSLVFTEGAVTCGDAPPAPANGQRSGSSTTVGSTVTYICNHGYSFSKQAPSRLKLTCMADGSWNGTAPQCYVVSCLANFMDIPVKPANGQRNISGATVGSTVTYSCDPGYKLMGPSTVTCLASGKWNTSGNAVQCIASCTKPCQNGGTCTAPDTCTCDVGWTGMQCESVVSCLANLKDLPAQPANGQRYISGATFSSTVTYSCDPGYKLIGPSAVTCLASGQWNTSRSAVQCITSCTKPCQNGGTCTAPDTCICDVGWTGMQCESALRVPSQVTGLSLSKVVRSGQPALRVTWTAPQSDLTISQYKVQYKRSRDAEWGSETTISGSPPPTSIILRRLDASTEYNVRVRAVSADGAGMWSVVLTERTYETVTCGDAPPASANGTRSGSGTTFGSTVTYTCNHGYTFYTQAPSRITLSCMADGSWNGSAPQCYVISCLANLKDLPAQPANGQRYISGTTFGSTVTYSCDAGYKLIGPSTVTCLANRRWNTSGKAVQCIEFCNKSCQNGGTCTAPDTCTCDVRWTGKQCETALTAPSQVTGLSLSKAMSLGSPALRMTWTTPQSEMPISRYTVQYRKIGTTSWGSAFNILEFPPSTSSNLTGLDAGTEYNARVRAVSVVGAGNWSAVQTERTYKRAPHPNPTTVHAVAVNSFGVIIVSWNAPTVSSGELPITGYRIQYKVKGVTDNDMTLMVESSPAEVTDLVPGTEYQVFVASVNAIGIGKFCCRTITVYVRPSKATPQPHVVLTNSALQNLSISWSVTSPQDVTSYIVLWWKGSAVIGRSDALSDTTTYNIKGLDSNSAYQVIVQARGLLGNSSSDFKELHTMPNQIQELRVLVLPTQILQFSWQPADDAGRSPINYIINATMTGIDYNNSTSVMHPMTMATLSGLPPYSAGTVSVWAQNPGALSKPVSLKFRMVNIVTNVTGVSAEWDAGFTSLRVTLPEGGTYRISYSTVNKSNDSNFCTPWSRVVMSSSISLAIMDKLSLKCFYILSIEVVSLDFTEPVNESVGVGIGIGVVAIVISILLLGICCCCFARHRRHMDKKIFIPFKQRRTLCKSTLNEPAAVAMADVVDDQVDLQMAPDPDDGNADALVTEPNTASTHLFPAHVREMHRNRDEGFEREFGNVHDDPIASDSIAKQNRGRNRYLNTNTFDHSRVVLKVPDENGCDYINASYIEGYGRSGHYIAAQGPRLEEVTIFWQMVMEHKPAVIVMLTNVEENGKRKCEKYWNDDLEKPYDAGNGFSAVTTGYRTFADYEVRDITVQNSTDRPHKVTHFQYTSWPDHGVPLHPSSLVKFAQEVRKVHSNSQAPMVVHCSAGVGRTGTFITLDAMMERLMEKEGLNIFEFVTEMRTRRKQMVQTMDQYVFIHDALSDFITCGDTSVMAHELKYVIDNMDKKDAAGKSGFENQFEFIGSVCKMPVGEDGSFAKKSVVAKRNRYKDKYPYSTNYLHIAGRPPNNAADYINATMLASYSNKRGLVAAQSPLESTRTDVWELIWQFRTKTVVLLGPLKEGKKIMCSPFWPNESVHSTEYGQLLVTFVNTTPKPDWEMTDLQVADKNRSSESFHEVTLFHFVSWPREGRPPIESMLKMMGEVENKQKESKAPLMVMCDDGMSRTGVFITCMSEIERVKVEGGVDIFQTVKTARAQRPHMVFSTDQYKLCFEILQSYLDSFDTYANFKAV